MADGVEAMTALLDDDEARFWRTPCPASATVPTSRGRGLFGIQWRAALCGSGVLSARRRQRWSLPMRARSMRRRGAEAVDVVMPPFERAKASAAASKHFFPAPRVGQYKIRVLYYIIIMRIIPNTWQPQARSKKYRAPTQPAARR